ncbi:hypothetical protein GGX14DRAFT_343845 [Mycena pura]|uniref:Uncharacterized protein n=1 Tax=Mycena pura TaxID=153505 RepID=A0AAD7E5B9_9AGAR|nr:hypothetical protein GGX14DRAFT_343845 [Mycena pura]
MVQYARRDTVLIDAGGLVMGGIVAARALLLFSLTFREQQYECALVHWITPVGAAPDPDTGMWVVEPEYLGGAPSLQVVNVDTIARASHLIGVYGTIPEGEVLVGCSGHRWSVQTKFSYITESYYE